MGNRVDEGFGLRESGWCVFSEGEATGRFFG